MISVSWLIYFNKLHSRYFRLFLWLWLATQGGLLLLLSRFSRVRLRVTPWTAARQAPPTTGFSRQEYWSGLPFPPPHGGLGSKIEGSDLKGADPPIYCISASLMWSKLAVGPGMEPATSAKTPLDREGQGKAAEKKTLHLHGGHC